VNIFDISNRCHLESPIDCHVNWKAQQPFLWKNNRFFPGKNGFPGCAFKKHMFQADGIQRNNGLVPERDEVHPTPVYTAISMEKEF
jgi:hypothetical protein